jgi:hypothetical protein
MWQYKNGFHESVTGNERCKNTTPRNQCNFSFRFVICGIVWNGMIPIPSFLTIPPPPPILGREWKGILQTGIHTHSKRGRFDIRPMYFIRLNVHLPQMQILILHNENFNIAEWNTYTNITMGIFHCLICIWYIRHFVAWLYFNLHVTGLVSNHLN